LASEKPVPSCPAWPLLSQAGDCQEAAMKRKKADATADQDSLIPLFDVARRIVKELEDEARELGELGKDKVFSERRAGELREKIVEGFFDWAIRRMGADIETYLEEGSAKFPGPFHAEPCAF